MSPRPTKKRRPNTSKRPAKSGKFAKSGKPAKPTKLRIIGGDMRGRTVTYHGAEFTRPMKDNIRENLFNILGMAVRGSICFDLFAGTGALAFEALSRGARSTVMVEQNRRAVQCIEKTAQTLDVESRIRMITGDTFRVAETLLAPPPDDTPWIVFLCPPYALWHESLSELNRVIRLVLENAPPGSILVAETEKSFDTVGSLPECTWDFREYGQTRLALTKPAMKCGMLP